MIVEKFTSPMERESIASCEAGDEQPGLSQHWFGFLGMLMLAAGLVLVVIGSLMPAYTDPIVAERVRSGQECQPKVPNTNENRQCDTELWYRFMNTLRTSKWSLVDGGAGLLVSGLAVGAFSWWTRKKRWRVLSTPKSSLTILFLVGFSWLMQIPAYGLFFITNLTRGYYPHWADTIVIPMHAFESILLKLFLPYMAIWLLFVVGARLPAAVFSIVPGRPLVNIIWADAAALLLVPIGLVLIGAILEGPIMMVPFLWLTLWLALCARAAALTRHRPNSQLRA